MKPTRIIHPDGWKPAKGYANGVLAGDGTLYVGGQIGWGADQVFRAHDFIGQLEQVLQLHRQHLVALDLQLAGEEQLHAVGLRVFDELLESRLTAPYKIGYARILQFGAPTAEELADALDDLDGSTRSDEAARNAG